MHLIYKYDEEHHYKVIINPHHFKGINTAQALPAAVSKEIEFETFKRSLTLYHNNILFTVSHVWDIWKVFTKFLPRFNYKIFATDRKIVIRPNNAKLLNKF